MLDSLLQEQTKCYVNTNCVTLCGGRRTFAYVIYERRGYRCLDGWCGDRGDRARGQQPRVPDSSACLRGGCSCHEANNESQLTFQPNQVSLFISLSMAKNNLAITMTRL